MIQRFKLLKNLYSKCDLYQKDNKNGRNFPIKMLYRTKIRVIFDQNDRCMAKITVVNHENGRYSQFKIIAHFGLK